MHASTVSGDFHRDCPLIDTNLVSVTHRTAVQFRDRMAVTRRSHWCSARFTRGGVRVRRAPEAPSRYRRVPEHRHRHMPLLAFNGRMRDDPVVFRTLAKGRLTRLAGALLIGALAVGCSSGTGDVLTRGATASARAPGEHSYRLLPTGWRPGEASLTALTAGAFHAILTPRGACAWLGPQRRAFVWPVGYRVRFNPTELLDPHGKVIAREGQMLGTGGGLGTATHSGACVHAGQSAWFANGGIQPAASS